MKFSFPSIKAYDGTTDPDDHVAQYRQRMLAVALPKGSREATMCKRFGSTLTGLTLQWYINLPSRSIASFPVLTDKFVEQFASIRDLEKTSDNLYKILQHRAEPLRGYITRFNQEKVAIPECNIPTAISVIKRAWAQVKWEEDVASRAKAQQKPDPKTIRPDRTERDEKPFQRPAMDSGNRNRGRYHNRPIEKAEGMVVSTWPDISHLSVSRGQTSLTSDQCSEADGPTGQIKVNELLKKGQLREFLSEKAKSHLSKETTGKPTKAAPVSPPCQDRVIHVISGANCLVKRIRVNNGSSDNIIFQAAYKDLGMEESALTRRITPLIGFIGCWGKIFHEEITPASGFQVPTSRFRVPAPRSGSLPPGLGPTSSVRLPGRHVYNSTYWLRPRSPAHQQGPPCSLKHLNTSCSMQHIDRSGGTQGPTLVVITIDHISKRPWDLHYRRNITRILSKLSQPQPPGDKKQLLLTGPMVRTAGNTSPWDDSTMLTLVARFDAGITYESLLVPTCSRSQPGITFLQSLVPTGSGLHCKAGPCNLRI
ncbi:hypothetical protein DY000_02053650 [Brassica cretica]|uniref:Retrotransposon gag domain-containing protein n=2 Tax=Brassica cretica TaxID=69181 RepID=A0ABQ7A6N7_BRACR|nr:hypothetical protein DY000_02053650 [Brassica cretica]